MKKYLRIWSFLLAVVFCLSFSTVAFAAENTEQISTNAESRSTGNVLASKTASLSLSNQKFDIQLTSLNWSTDFTVAVFGKTNTNYTVYMQHGSDTYYLGTVTGNGQGTSLFTLACATPGLYTFTVISSSNTTDNFTAIATIYD